MTEREFQTPNINIPREYRQVVRDPELRQEVIQHAIETYIPFWEPAGIPVEDMVAKQQQNLAKTIDKYETHKEACSNGEGKEHCEIAREAETHLAFTVHQADKVREQANMPKIVTKDNVRTIPSTGVVFASNGIK